MRGVIMDVQCADFEASVDISDSSLASNGTVVEGQFNTEFGVSCEECSNTTLIEGEFSIQDDHSYKNWSNATLVEGDVNHSCDEIGVCDSPPRTSTPLKRRRISMPLQDPKDIIFQACCEEKCLQHLCPHDITETERAFKELGKENKQKQYILDQIRLHSYTKYIKTKPVVVTMLIINGKQVCQKAWCLVHNVTFKKYKECVRAFRENKKEIADKHKGRRWQLDKTSRALGWMRFRFERIGDFMPHRHKVLLPVFYNYTTLYQRMVRELQGRGFSAEDTISYSYFRAIWLKFLPEFVIEKRSEFSECGDCVEIREALEKARSESERQAIRGTKEHHEEIIRTERAFYHTAREKAIREPKELTCIIQDAMDQKKTNVPRLHKDDKKTEHLLRVPMHATGTIFHTNVAEGKIPNVRLDMNQFPHDSNLTMNNFLWTLEENIDKLGRNLHAQFDNCFRENKNRFMLSLASVLVEYNIFQEVLFHFLPVGHTHEDVDQMFSRVSTALYKTSAYTIPDLQNVIHQSYTPPIKTQEIKYLYNIKEWLEPHMESTFSGHSVPHCFRFRRFEGKVRMHYKMWSTDHWLPEYRDGDEDSYGLTCLQSVPDVNDIPDFVEPCLEKVDVNKLIKDLPEGYGSRLPDSASEYWKAFFRKIREYEQVPDRHESWPLQRLAEAVMHPSNEIDEEAPRNIMAIKEKITAPCPPVIIGKKGQRARNIQQMDDYSSLKPGVMVAVFCPTYEQVPQIGRVVELQEGQFKIHWYSGKWNTAWHPSHQRIGRKKTPWEDWQPNEAALLWDFSLTARNMLKKVTVAELRIRYNTIRLQHDNSTDL